MKYRRQSAEPPSPSTVLDPHKQRFLLKLSIVIAGGLYIDGFILGGVGVVMPEIEDELGLSSVWFGLIGASALIGIFFGGPIGGVLADKFGRKPLFVVDLIIFILGSAAQFFVDDAWQLFAVRVVMGMAIGADYAIGWPLLAEFSPARVRGKLLAYQAIAFFAGYLSSFALGYLLYAAFDADWRVILGMSTIPSLIVFLLRIGTPESPRWLVSRGRVDEGMSIAREYMYDAEVQDISNEEQTASVGYLQIFSPRYRKTTLFVLIFWFCNITPYYAIGTYSPIVLKTLGVEDGLMGGLILNGVFVAGAIATVLVVERMRRRLLAVPPAWVQTAALVTIGLFSGVSHWVILVCFTVFCFANSIGASLCTIYPGEVFPTEIRGAGVGLGTAVSRVGAAIGTFLLPMSISGIGMNGTMMIAAALCAVGALAAQFWAPETRGVSLNEASAPSAEPVPPRLKPSSAGRPSDHSPDADDTQYA